MQDDRNPVIIHEMKQHIICFVYNAFIIMLKEYPYNVLLKRSFIESVPKQVMTKRWFRLMLFRSIHVFNVTCWFLLLQILKPAEKKKPNSSRPVTPPRNTVPKQAKKWFPRGPAGLVSYALHVSRIRSGSAPAAPSTASLSRFFTLFFLLYCPERPLAY